MTSTDIYTILSSLSNNHHYLNRYIKFIRWCQEVNKNLDEYTYVEKHHICPKAKSMFPTYSNFKEFPWNLAKLTPGQHFVAHHILARAYSNRAMIGAFIRLIRATNRNHRSYSIMRLRMSEEMKTNNPMLNPETRSKMIKSCIKSFTPERRKQNSENSKRPCSNNAKEKLSKFWTGKLKGSMTDTHKENLLKSCCKFIYVTPIGEFTSSTDAGKALNISSNCIRKRCHNNTHIIKNSRSLKDKSLIGKTWLEIGYYRKNA